MPCFGLPLMLALVAAVTLAAPSSAQQATPLFASDTPLRIEVRGPITDMARGNRDQSQSRAATLAMAGSSERMAIRLTPRGITRLRKDTCDFPPLRVDFAAPPGAGSPFAGQRRIKLVTHCRSDAGFQQYLLLEYAAYRLFNLITPASFRARLAMVDYVGDDGRAMVSRMGFFLEERDDVGRRIGLAPAKVGTSVALEQLDAASSARVSLFEYMVGNLDWSLRASPPGDACCHNSRLFVLPTAAVASANLMPVPYDYDFSGLVDAPYAVPPDGSEVSVRKRVYRGFCRHNPALPAAAAEFRAKRGALLAELALIPGLEPRTQRKAAAYLEQFFAAIASDAQLPRISSSCIL